MTSNHRVIAAFISAATAAAALALVADRSGVIAWSTLIIASMLLAKIWLKPARSDLAFSIAVATLPALAWLCTFYYVISTWETGEVVELVIETATGSHTARVWVLDINDEQIVYYDAPAEVASSLLAGTPLQFIRGGDQARTVVPHATRAEDLSEGKADRVFEAMAAKYGARVDAADIYYLMLGRSEDRVALVATLTEP